MRSPLRGLAAPVALLAVCAVPAAAQDERPKVLCMGDSITLGGPPFDEEDMGGYPRRLQPLLRRGGLTDIVVENHGVGGDDTMEALARLGSVLARGRDGDIFILKLGTNDIELIAGGRMLYDDTIANLDLMLDFAEGSGLRGIPATIVPRLPGGLTDRSNGRTYELNQRIREDAHRQRRELIDFWDAFPYRSAHTFAALYYAGPDPVGHPNAAGFDRMAEVAAAVVLDGDGQRPVDGRLRSPLFVDGVAPALGDGAVFDIDLYDFGSGIQLSTATFRINGAAIPTMVTGNARLATLLAEWDGVRRCKAVVTAYAEDRAEPPNELEFAIATYPVQGSTLISGDGNGDCRVDGRDLVGLGRHFGTVVTDLAYNSEYDFIRDESIDGDDLARLAANFGRGSL